MVCRLIQPRELFGPPARMEELREAWRRNDGLPVVGIHPLGRPTFAELFARCAPNAINIICNADIYFRVEAIERIVGYYESLSVEARPLHALALSRWDVGDDGTASLWDHRDSQDAWVVYGAPPPMSCDYQMGVPGCDNRLLHIMREAGLTVTNPSRTIHAMHLHRHPHRSYINGNASSGRGGKKLVRIPPPYAFAEPCYA